MRVKAPNLSVTFCSCVHVLGVCLPILACLQEPEGQPLMLDRFDARWMLDPADLSKGSATLSRTSSLTAEVIDGS